MGLLNGQVLQIWVRLILTSVSILFQSKLKYIQIIWKKQEQSHQSERSSTSLPLSHCSMLTQSLMNRKLRLTWEDMSVKCLMQDLWDTIYRDNNLYLRSSISLSLDLETTLTMKRCKQNNNNLRIGSHSNLGSSQKPKVSFNFNHYLTIFP